MQERKANQELGKPFLIAKHQMHPRTGIFLSEVIQTASIMTPTVRIAQNAVQSAGLTKAL